ncbi:pilus assembly protein PilF [Francisella frigiditurris]|uniref:TPR repeat family protein n=1 Tax=Francisella frigiditurris TaxID=1542390 RepID=A0A1J0KSL2_9GAMM|nr:pilus assembly protein PilF [Francisella frigiditurris]APC96612.1 TPR repeat family protein [Francisella frigiditurris]
MRYKLVLLIIFLSTFFICSYAADTKANTNSNGQSKSSNQSQNQASFTLNKGSLRDNLNYKEATKINAELAIIYTSNSLLDRAKAKLIKAQDLAKEHGYDLAIVDYAAGFYYQAIGSNSRAEDKYKEALSDHRNNYEAINFYAQFLCVSKDEYSKAIKLFEESLTLRTNNNMAQTLYLYAECLNKEGKKQDAIEKMIRATKFNQDYGIAKLRLAEMYYDEKDYKNAYKILYAMKNNKEFFINLRVLQLRLKLAEIMNNKNEAATVRLIISSKDDNDDDNMIDFYLPSSADMEL